MVFLFILFAVCLLLLLLCGAFAEVGTLLAVFGGFLVLYVIYVGVRAAIDPEYKKRIEREAEEERKRKREADRIKMLKKRRELLDKGYYSCRKDDDSGPPLAIL